MNAALFRYSCKRALPLWLAFTALMSLYAFAVVRAYDPATGAALASVSQALPQQALTMLGIPDGFANFTSFIVSYLYGMLLLALPMLFTVILSVQLMARPISRGTMSYLLASPNSRKCIAATQRNVLVCSLLLMIAVCCGVTIALCEYFYPGYFALRHFMLLSVCVFALQFAFAGMCFFFSCQCRGSGRALAVSAAACVLFYTIRLLANLGGSFSFLQYLTPYSLLNPSGIMNTDLRACLLPLILLFLGVILFALASRVFRRRAMPF